MRIALVSSRIDPAGCNIRDAVCRLLDGRSDWPLTDSAHLTFHEVSGRLIEAEGVDRELDCDMIFFLSRHASRVRPVPTLTVHVTGNPDTAEMGGSPRTIPPAAPAWMQAILRGLAAGAPEGYRVSYEVTHHGPTDLTIPSLFVEIGSTEREWRDETAAEAVARSILTAVPDPLAVPLIGFGGTHYAPRQTAIATGSRGAFGHMVPSRLVSRLDREMVDMMRRMSGAVAAYIDRKALNKGEFSHIRQLLDAARLPVVSGRELRGMGSLRFEDYLALRELAAGLVEEPRVVVHRLTGSGRPAVARIPPTLFAGAWKRHPDGLRRLLDRLPAAHIEGRGRECLPDLLTWEHEREDLINALICECVKVLVKDGTAIARGDRLIIREARFDIQKARKLGIPQGPLYGELASGREVRIGDRVITPDMVRSVSEVEIAIPGLERYL
ncbi:MAG: D-aminoacyl-tRNA deacylase [Methanoculleaceae archaeon]